MGSFTDCVFRTALNTIHILFNTSIALELNRVLAVAEARNFKGH